MKIFRCGFITFSLYLLGYIYFLLLNTRSKGTKNRNTRKNSFECETWKCVRMKSKKLKYSALVREVINPFSLWFLSDYHYGNEFFEHFEDHEDVLTIMKSKPFNQENCHNLPNMAVLLVDPKLFPDFVNYCVPRIKSRFVLLTGRWQLPMLKKSNLTETVLTNKNLIHWFSQNPIHKHAKYSGIPYGVHQDNLITLFKIVHEERNKSTVLSNFYLKQTNSDRTAFLGGKRFSHRIYCRKIKSTKFLISPVGDRPDTYRHWESIALTTVPICNCPKEFVDLFGSNGIVATTEKMLEWLKHNRELKNRKIKLSQDVLSTGYWQNRIRDVQDIDDTS